MKISLREIFLLVLIAALAVGWGTNFWRNGDQIRDLNDKLTKTTRELKETQLKLLRSMESRGRLITAEPKKANSISPEEAKGSDRKD